MNTEKAKAAKKIERKRWKKSPAGRRSKARCEARYRQKPEVKEKKIVARKKFNDLLPDCYISMLLRQNTKLRPSDIPQSLIEVKRLHLQVIRLIKRREA